MTTKNNINETLLPISLSALADLSWSLKLNGIITYDFLNKTFSNCPIDSISKISIDLNNQARLSHFGLRYKVGVTADMKSFIDFYTLSANQGKIYAQYCLAQYYETGLTGILDKNFKRAINLYTKASQNNQPYSIFRLGYLY